MKILALTIAALCLLTLPLSAQDPKAGFRVDFQSLDGWKPLTFPKIPRHSTYAIQKDGKDGILAATADQSASGIIYERPFNIYKTPIVRWR
jgi:hypothetical protein